MLFKDFKTTSSKIILLSLILASALGFFEVTAVNIALPAIQKYFNASVHNLQWIINSYQLMLAVFMLISGSFGDIFGKKKTLLLGLAGFTIGSALCGTATTIWWLIGARVIQGIGAAIMIPQCLAIINNSFESKIRGQAVGLWSGISGAMLILGPFFSGFIIDTIGWHYIFLLMVPIGIVALWSIWKYVPDTRHEARKVDLPGVLLIGTGLFMISFALIEESDIVIGILGAAFLAIFVWWQNQTKNPLIDISLLRNRNVLLANLYTFFLYTCISVLSVFTVMYLQQLRHISASITGLMVMPISITITLLSLFSGRLSDTFGVKKPMVLGALLVTVGLFLLGFIKSDFNYWRDIFPGILLVGLGFGLFIPALTVTALDVDDKHSGAASGINYAISRIAGLLGVVILGAFLLSTFTFTLRNELGKMNLKGTVTHDVFAQRDKLLDIDVGNLPLLLEIAVQKKINASFIRAYRYQLWICAVLALLGAGSAFFIQEKKQNSRRR
jgi:EmrB/QacA subfamily drug resistance transporter